MTTHAIQEQTKNRTTLFEAQPIVVFSNTKKSRGKTFFEPIGNRSQDRHATEENLDSCLSLFDTSNLELQSRVQRKDVASVPNMAHHSTGCSLRSAAFSEPQTFKKPQPNVDRIPINASPATLPTKLTPAPSQRQSATACHLRSAGGITSNQTGCHSGPSGYVTSYEGRIVPISNRMSSPITPHVLSDQAAMTPNSRPLVS